MPCGRRLMGQAKAQGARVHFDEVGSGLPVIALHGFSETADYWRVGGFAERVAPHLWLIALDMRGHGRTQVTDEPAGFDVETIADDIEAVADHLGLDSFDLLGHATGSVVALRYAMRRPPRLRRLVVTSAASATQMAPPAFFERMVAFYAQHAWPEILPRLRRRPEPFLNGLDRSPDAAALWARIEQVFTACDPAILSRFAANFYDDPDPQIARLGQISAPTLVISAELDALMLEPSRLIARAIPGAQAAMLAQVGHMTALECPEALAALVVGFLEADGRHCAGGDPPRVR